MKLDISNCELSGNQLIIDIQPEYIDKLKKIVESDNLKEFTIDYKFGKRSLDANAALWVTLDKMAKVLHTTKEELYLEMLKRYGVFTFAVIPHKAVYRFKNEFKTAEEIGEVEINGKVGVQFKCYYGSSQYDKAEFSRLLDGVITDAKEIGVEFISKADRDYFVENLEV